MDNSYVSINVDLSPDVVVLLQLTVLVGGLIYGAQRLVKSLKVTPAKKPKAA